MANKCNISVRKKVIKNTQLRRDFGSDVIKPTNLYQVKVNGKVAEVFLERKKAVELANKLKKRC